MRDLSGPKTRRALKSCASFVAEAPVAVPAPANKKILHSLAHDDSQTTAAVEKSPGGLCLGGIAFGPDHYDFLLQSSNSLNPLKEIHALLTTMGFVRTCPHLASRLIIHYAALGLLSGARSLFLSVCGRNSFVWNTMIRGYANAGFCEETLELFALMHKSGVPTNNFTFPFALKACAMASLLFAGKMVHGQILKTGFESDSFVEAGLVDMYAKCTQIEEARKVFDEMSERDLVSWTSMITGYEKSERAMESLKMFSQMQGAGLRPDSVTVVTVASAVAQLGALRESKSVHAFIIRNSFEKDLAVENSIITMYTRCGDVDLARAVFDRMVDRDRISWNSMISGYTQNGYAREALLLFDEMKLSGIKPNLVTMLIVVSACGSLGSLRMGKEIHKAVVESRIEFDTTLRNAVLDMFAKCGDLKTSVQLFESMHEKNATSWNVMISGHGMHGYGKEAVALFYRMQEEGFKPDHVTFTCLLSACSHSGLLDEGRKCFYEMPHTSMMPTVKHYACMVDMLGRAGFFDEARHLISQMPLEPNDSIWGALLGGSKIHKNLEVGEYAASKLFHAEPEHPGYYVLMSNVYAATEKWDEARKLRAVMRHKRLKKPAACSLIELGGEVHAFYSSDRSHPALELVYEKTEKLITEIRGLGYIPEVSSALHDVEEEDKEHSFSFHSEKLAVAFGLMHTVAGMPIQITNNLRVCGDCHSAFMYISKIYGRKITLRDANRFHHFENGLCSCGGYW